ncbi:hypothetical protein PINS_up007302 [Pythium insidiosum]|nr:hypothetical protein PINS_up007302 [Pythium insidiosum]
MSGRNGAGGRGPALTDGNWACPNPGCANVNFARRTECNRCHTARPEGAGASASNSTSAPDARGPPGLFKSTDWTCVICGNVNWERRSECNICKSPKPGMPGLDEKRDGAGGGFNERQERVASAKTEVDEDGYDDFGMKKKKVKASRAEREAAALARLKQTYSAIIGPTGDSMLPTSIANSKFHKRRETAPIVASAADGPSESQHRRPEPRTKSSTP